MKKYLLILTLFLCSSWALADSARFASQVKGLDRLLDLKAGQSARISVSTGEGLVKLVLKKQRHKAPAGNVIGDGILSTLVAPDIDLFQGRVLPKRNRQNKLLAASASIYKNKLDIFLAGNRKKYYKISVDLLRTRQFGRVSHVPGTVLLPCDVGGNAKGVRNSSPGNLPIFKAVATSALTLQLGMDADYEFYQANSSDSSDTLAALQTIANNVGSIYSSQLGIDVNLSYYNIFTSNSHPYTSNNTATLLNQFGDYLSSNSNHLRGDLRHLMTGKNTAYQGNSSIAGLAYLSVVCSSSTANIGLSERFSSTVQHLIVAHELGHNFGANHDSSAPGSIMYPSISPGQTTFSSTSLDQINDHLQGNTACLEDSDGGSGGGGVASDITLRAKLTNRNKFKFVLIPRTASIVGCTVNIYGARSSSSLSSDPTLIVSTTGTAAVGAKQRLAFARANRSPSADVYFRAEVSCSEDYTSNTRRLAAGGGNNLRSVGVTSFLNYLVTKFS